MQSSFSYRSRTVVGLPTSPKVSGASYRYADLKQSEIRILQLLPTLQKEKDQDGTAADKEIRCELRHVSLDDEVSYEALSYVWRTPIKAREITVSNDGDRKLRVTENLYSALTRLRQDTFARDLWIDQLCTYSDRSCIKHLRNLRLRPQFSEWFDSVSDWENGIH